MQVYRTVMPGLGLIVVYANTGNHLPEGVKSQPAAEAGQLRRGRSDHDIDGLQGGQESTTGIGKEPNWHRQGKRFR